MDDYSSMNYKFTKTEKNNAKASEFETKSLLYLASNEKKYKKISFLTVDCFNDVSGICDMENIWDVQSKGEKNLTPRKIGTYLITLYENHKSAFSKHFKEFIFFMPKLDDGYLISPDLSSYTIENFKLNHRSKVTEGLISAAKLDDGEDLNSFFSKLTFVEDRSAESFYIKGIMKFKSSKLNDDNFFIAIFKEIRDRQTALKNSLIENVIINKPHEVLTKKRHITTEELQVFVLNRLVGADIFASKKSLTTSYAVFTKDLDEDEIEDHIFQQNAALSRAFFDKNNQKNFWKLFNSIFKSLSVDPKKKVSDVIAQIDNELIVRTEHMSMDSTRFLVALVRDGLISEN